MMELNTIKETVKRAQNEGYNISEHALRIWIKQGRVPVRYAGERRKTALVYFPNIVAYLKCEDGLRDNEPPAQAGFII